MANHSITQQPELTNSTLDLLPDEYIRFEYNYKPGCCCFSSKTTLVTNQRLITRMTKTSTICSRKTSSGKEKHQTIFLKDITHNKQIPSNENKWWMKCLDILTCTCSNQQIDWLESCHGMDNLAMDTNKSMINIPKTSFIEKF